MITISQNIIVFEKCLNLCFYCILLFKYYTKTIITGDISLKTNTWPIFTLSVRNGPNLQSYLFQDYIYLSPSQVEQNYTIYLKKMTKIIY